MDKRKWKKRITLALAEVLSVVTLVGCGGSGSKVASLSSKLSKDKVIAYQVSSVDKAKTPDNVYFFEKGKLTILPGSAFDMTMGDFSQMTDKEIWKAYEKVRESYAEEYKAEKLESGGIADKISQLEKEIEELNRAKTELDSAEKFDYSAKSWIYHFSAVADVVIYMVSENPNDDEVELFEICDKAIEEESLTLFLDYAAQLIAASEEKLADLQKLQEEADVKGPFYDQSFTFAIETDASGNIVVKEKLVYPTTQYTFGGEAPSTYYETLEFVNVEGAEYQIYDTTYYCMGVKDDKVFCTREALKLDEVGNKSVLVDADKDKLNALYEEEVLKRYK